MSRDSSGNYTLPGAFNPVLTGTTITSSWANNTLNDLAAAMTDSLSRSGKGSMQAALLLLDGTSGAPGLAFGSEQTTGLYRNGASNPTFVVTGVPIWSANASKQFLLYPIDNQADIIANLAAATNGFYHDFQHGGTSVGRIGTGPVTMAGAALGDFGISSAGTGTLRLGNTGGTNTCITIDNTGHVVFNAPTTANNPTVTIGASANFYGLIVNGNSTAGQSLGVAIRAGTNTSDFALAVSNQANSKSLLFVRGDGTTFVLDAAGNQQPVGTRNIPPNTQNTNYTFTSSDAGRCVTANGVGPYTYTVPANIFNAGDVITVHNAIATGGTGLTITPGASMSMFWQSSGSGSTASSGSRTLAGLGIATIYIDAPTQCTIGGTGIA